MECEVTVVDHPLWLNFLVGTVFCMFIVAGPLVVSLMYPLVAMGGSWTTLFRRDYGTPVWVRSRRRM